MVLLPLIRSFAMRIIMQHRHRSWTEAKSQPGRTMLSIRARTVTRMGNAQPYPERTG